jgi:hypothetical protein
LFFFGEGGREGGVWLGIKLSTQKKKSNEVKKNAPNHMLPKCSFKKS